MTAPKLWKDIINTKSYNALKDIYNNIKKTCSDLCLDIEKPDDTIMPPKSIEEFLIIRQLALTIAEESSFSLVQKNKYRRYYFKCCVSEKCDYIFTVLKKLNFDKEVIKVNREDDIVNLFKDWNCDLVKYLNSLEGAKVYYDIAVHFLLKRFAYFKALKLLNNDNWKNFIPLRIIFGLLVTNYFAVSSRWVWMLVSKAIEKPVIFWLTFGIFSVLSWLYLSFVECFWEIERNAKASMKRGKMVWIWNLFWSLIIAYPLIKFIILSSGNEFIVTGLWWKPLLLYSQIIVFISLFIQHFWQEKTITEPY